MIPWIKDLLYDPTSFANFARAILFLGAEIVPQTVDVGAKGWWVAKVVQAAALLVRAGDKNPPAGAPS